VGVLPARTRHKYVRVGSDSASCLVRSWQAIPPPQLQPERSSSFRNHHPGFNLTVVHLSETTDLCFRTEARVCGTLLQDRTRQDAESERHMDVLERVLKKGTARPRLPYGQRVQVYVLPFMFRTKWNRVDCGLDVPD